MICYNVKAFISKGAGIMLDILIMFVTDYILLVLLQSKISWC